MFSLGSRLGRKVCISILFFMLLPLAILFWSGKGATPTAEESKPVMGSKDPAPEALERCSATSALHSDLCTNLKTRATLKVPEPAPLLLVGTGLLSVAALIRKRVKMRLNSR